MDEISGTDQYNGRPIQLGAAKDVGAGEAAQGFRFTRVCCMPDYQAPTRS